MIEACRVRIPAREGSFFRLAKTTLLRNLYLYIHFVYSHENPISSFIRNRNLCQDEINNKPDIYSLTNASTGAFALMLFFTFCLCMVPHSLNDFNTPSNVSA